MRRLFFPLCLTGILLGCGHTPRPETPAQPSPGGGVIIDMFPPPKTGDWGTEKGYWGRILTLYICEEGERWGRVCILHK